MLTTSLFSADARLVQNREDEKISENQLSERSFPKMKIDQVRPAVLTVESGKCVCVEKKRKPSLSHQLVLDYRTQKVKVYYILHNETSKCMAFCFERGENIIFPVTDGTEVKLKVLPKRDFKEDIFNETFLFQWVDSGTNDWRSLKSVAEPNMYLFVEKEKVTINPVGMPNFRIVEDKVEPKKTETQYNRSLGSAKTRSRDLTPVNKRADSKDFPMSWNPSKPKYARTPYNRSPGSAKTQSRDSTLNVKKHHLKRKTKED